MSATQSGYIVKSGNDLPLHLQARRPSFSTHAEMVLKRPLEQLCPGEDRRVELTGAVEFLARIAPGMLTDLCDPDELSSGGLQTTHRFRVVYDPEIQRGIKETKSGPKEFLREAEINSMMKDIENNQFECPQLNWNLRAGETTWAYLLDEKELHVYQGVATRPDTNHRHHAIIRFHKRYLEWIESTRSPVMGTYNPDREYSLTIYTDTFAGEAHRFYVYNFLGWRVSTTTAHYIESKTSIPALHARLARELLERSGVLGLPNVEIISNQLSRNSAKMVTFGTLAEALKAAYPGLIEDTYAETVEYLVKFLERLHAARPNEIAVLSVAHRQRVRDTSLADQSVMWHGYFRLAADLQGLEDWQARVGALGNRSFSYLQDSGDTKPMPVAWKGDLFDRSNPLWSDVGVLAPGKRGLRVVNNRQGRVAAYGVLKTLVSGQEITQRVARTLIG